MDQRIAPVNRIVSETLHSRLAALDNAAASPDGLLVTLTEFDDVRYLLSAEAASPQLLELSLSLPADPSGERGASALPPGATEAVGAALGAWAALAPSPTPGYALTLRLDLSRLPSPADTAAREAQLERAASLRSLVQGAQLRELLLQLASGRASQEGLLQVVHRPGEAFFAKRSDAEAVTIVFPMRFADAGDATLARTFLAQFAEARRAPALSTTPSCSYSTSAPLELRDAPAAMQPANAGYVSFVVFARHVAGGEKRVDAAAWALNTFYAFVATHIKCSKAYMHSHMRKRSASLLALLNRAKPEREAKEKKTASGRTFKSR